MSTICSKITAGFDFCGSNPIIAGIDDELLIGNKGDFTFTYDTTNPNIITNITAINTAKLYSFKGTNNAFGAVCKSVDSLNGPRYEHEIDFHIAGNSSAIKQQIDQLGKGKYIVIVKNNFKAGDSGIELYGLTVGLRSNAATRTVADEQTDGSWVIKLVRPQKLRESYPPASVFISATPGTGTATYDTTVAALLTLTA